MGYTFRIGHGIARQEADEDTGALRTYWSVEAVERPDAPLFVNDEMTGQTNARYPSYSAWAEFCRETGISSLFYNERGREKAGHPGAQVIRPEDLALVQRALAAWRAKARKPAGFGDDHDPLLARLIWLEYWMRWALENCANPIIKNT